MLRESSRFRLHIHASTICVGVFTMLLMAFIVCPGEGSTGFAFASSLEGGSYHGSWNTYLHGWPWIFLDRTVYDEPPVGSGLEPQTPWLTPTCWLMYRSDESKFSPIALAGDVLVALAISSIVIASFEIRRRRRQSVWQVQLVDVFTVVLIVSSILAWWKMQQVELTRQQMHASTIEERGHRVLGRGYGPVWIQRLTGIDFGILPGFDEVVLCRCPDEEVSAILPHLESLSDLRVICIVEESPGDAKSFPLSRFSSLEKLREIDLSDTAVDDSVIIELSKLPRLERIDLGRTDVSTKGVATLQKHLPHCEIVSPEDGWR